MNLRFKIAQSLPRDSVALRALLSIASIEETDTIPTACVTFGHHPRLLVNPNFINQHANTTIKLQTLIGHELLHVALGHTRRYTTFTALDNLVFDCLINATLAKADPTPERTALFRDFYSEERFPECFLRPPDDWHPGARVRLPKALKSSQIDGLPFVKDVYRRLWSDTGVSASEIRAAIKLGATGFDTPIDVAITQIPLLGGHDEDETHTAKGELTEHFADLIRQEIANKLTARGAPLNESFPLQQTLETITPPNLRIRKQLRSLFEHLAHGIGSAKLKSSTDTNRTYVTPVPHKDRRAIVQRLLGSQAMLYTATSTGPSIRSSEKIHVYLDVSGSMDSVIPTLYGAMRDCSQWIHDQIHLFSTEVADISLRQLKDGVRITTKGTDINCVAAHMEKYRVKRALLVTDGYVGKPSQDSERILDKTELAVGLAGPSRSLGELATFTSRCVEFV